MLRRIRRASLHPYPHAPLGALTGRRANLREYRSGDRATPSGAGDLSVRHPLLADLFDRVITGYESEAGLTEREKTAIPCAMLATQLLFVEVFVQRQDETHVAKNFDVFHWIYELKADIARRIDGAHGEFRSL